MIFDPKHGGKGPGMLGAFMGTKESAIPGEPVDIRVKSLSRFPGDLVITAGATTLDRTLIPGVDIISDMRGFRLVNVGAGVMIDINGGGLRAVFERDYIDWVRISTIRFVIPAGASVTIQQWAE